MELFLSTATQLGRITIDIAAKAHREGREEDAERFLYLANVILDCAFSVGSAEYEPLKRSHDQPC